MTNTASKSATVARKSRMWKWKNWGALALVAALGVGAASPARAVPIRVTYTDGVGEGFNDPQLGGARRASFEAAASVWGRRLAGDVPIEIEAEFTPQGGSATSAPLAQAGPANARANWTQGRRPPLADVFYVGALANNLAGVDLLPDRADIQAEFNSDVDTSSVFGDVGFFYGTGVNTGDNIDFFPVVLHELGHGLGFTGGFEAGGNLNNSANAAFSFDRLIGDGPSASASPVLNYSASDRASLFRSNNLFFLGPRARAAGGGRNARLYGPADFSSGSSIYHTDEATYSGAEELMTPLATSEPREPGPITFAMFLDIGWGDIGAVTPQPTSSPNPTPAPNPTANPSRPPNDDFERAQVLGGASGRVVGNNLNGTRQSGEPRHANNDGGASIWYRWTAPGNGPVSFSTAGSAFDTLLAAYTGTSVSALAQVAAQDDVNETTDRTSRIAFTALSGRTYFIAIDGYNPPDRSAPIAQGAASLSWSQAIVLPPRPIGPPNDLFERAQVLAGVAGRVAGTTLNATAQSGEPRLGGAARSVWYRWTAPRTARWTFTTQGSNLDTTLALFSGTAVNRLRQLGIDDNDANLVTSSVTVSLSAGAIVYAAVDSKGTSGGPFLLSFGAAPANDEANAPQVLAGVAGAVRGTSDFASRQFGEPNHAGIVGNRSVWYRWVAPATGIATWRTTGSSFDTLLAIYRGVPIGSLTAVASVDDSLPARTGTVSSAVTQGTTYLIAVDGKNGTSGAIVLGWSLQPSPPNDLFARAQVLGGASGAVNGTNLAAQLEEGELRHDRVGAGRSVWYRWVAPATGRATFLGFSSLFRPALAAYDGGSLLALAALSSRLASDARSMSIGFDVSRGQTYSIAVDSYNEGALTKSGGFSLRWTLNTSAISTSTRTSSLPTASLHTAHRVVDRRLAAWLP